MESVRHLAMLQVDSINSGNSKLLEIFVGIAALALLGQAIAMIVIAVGAAKAQKAVLGHVEDIKRKVLPLVDKSTVLIGDLTPTIREITTKVNGITAKVEQIGGHVESLSELVKTKAEDLAPSVDAAKRSLLEVNDTVQQVNRRAQEQIDRVNGMVSSALDATARLGKAVEQGIARPGREIAGIFSGVRAGIDSLVHNAKTIGVKPAARAAERGAARPTTTMRPAVRNTAASEEPISTAEPMTMERYRTMAEMMSRTQPPLETEREL